MTDLEMNLVDLRLTGAGQEGVRFGSKLLAKLNYLANGLSSSDYRPTDQHGEVQKLLSDQLRGHVGELETLIARDLAALNQLLRRRNLPIIQVRTRTPVS
jgi:hypothetical protein